MINTILFDLDGTLLPLDMNHFMEIYFEEMGRKFYDLINPKELIDSIWASTAVMVKNSELRTNEEVFMEDFQKRIKGDLETFKKRFDEFYDCDFLKVKSSVHNIAIIKETIDLLKEKNYNLVLATNPLFPQKAIHHRIEWAGLNPSDFSYITSYERNHYCKPQIKFYEEVLKDIDKNPNDCIMVGNDAVEDIIAGTLGVKTYLITNYAIDRKNATVKPDFTGTYDDFYNFVKELPQLDKK
jgi:FMN phosphatase YigB (HAD superfamily)